MRGLRILLTKQVDGGAVLKCIRGDGSATWQRHGRTSAAFFPLHDLTHFAVESELALRHAFYGLIAAGWDVEDTTGKGPRGPLPTEALMAERLVGALDLERSGSVTWTARELAEHGNGGSAASETVLSRPLDDDALTRIRARIHDLLGRWAALPAGGTLELSF